MTIHIIGGVYKELCSWPEHISLQGSAGRAALCMAQLDSNAKIELHARIDPNDKNSLEEVFAFNPNCKLNVMHCSHTVEFEYLHPLSTPIVSPVPEKGDLPDFDVSNKTFETSVVFGMIEANPIVNSKTAIYDPQNTYDPVLFSETGSRAERLIYVTNHNELAIFYGKESSEPDSVEVMAEWLAKKENAEGVVVKCGQRGLYVFPNTGNGWLPSYKTDKVFPIGSGDSYVAAFSHYFAVKKYSLIESAKKASVAAAYYVSHKTMNSEEGINLFGERLEPNIFKEGKRKVVYLAGPFFTLSDLWMVNEAKKLIEYFNMDVFSPYHAVGIGTADEVVQKDIDAIEECDVMYALFDGTDPGTLFEIGYARSINKPVVILAENPKDEELKMYHGSGCMICSDFASSIYHLSWINN